MDATHILNSKEFTAYSQDKKNLVLDLREFSEFSQGYILNSINIPFIT